MRIESYRTRLEEFEQNLNREVFDYYSGSKRQLDILSVYADHSDLFSAESIHEVESALKNTGETFASRKKSLEKIAQFLIDQYLDSHAAPQMQESTRFEAKQTLLWGGKEIFLFQVPAYLRDEPDAVTRRKLSERHIRALGESELRQENVARLRSASVALGFKNYAEARTRISGIDYKQLLHSFNAVLSRLEDCYFERLRASFEATLGFSLQEAGAWDSAHWQKKNDKESVFSKKNLFPIFKTTVLELGIQPERPNAVSFDLEYRTQKQPGSFCIPVRIPQEIKIVMQPEDGSRYYAALLHEGGHAYHFAWTSPSLPVEHRIWGDRSLSEAYAFLLERFVGDPQWLSHMLQFTKSKEFLHFQSLFRVFLLRRHTGRLCFAMRLHEQESLEGMPQIYAETMKAYTGLEHQPESWLCELPDGLDSADYLRGWAMESMLR